MIWGRGARLGFVLALAACGGAPSGAPACGAGSVRNVQPAGGDPAGLARRADRLLAGSVALDYERPFRGKPRELAPVIAAYVAACDAGDGRSCRRAAALESQTGGDSALRALVERCRAGDLDPCRALGDSVAEDHALRGWAGRAAACKAHGCDDELRRECEAGFALSCNVLASHGVSDDEAELARARELGREGCHADLGPACQLLGELRETDDDGVLRDRYRCELLGLDCMKYGLDLHATPLAARDVFERDCQYSRAHQANACRVLVEAYADHLFAEPIPDRARTVRDWICAQPEPDGELCAARPAAR